MQCLVGACNSGRLSLIPTARVKFLRLEEDEIVLIEHQLRTNISFLFTTNTVFSVTHAMSTTEDLNIYDEIEIEDMTFDPTLQIYHYPCPCGDRFEIAIDDLRDAQDIAVCPSCSLMIRVIFDMDDLDKEQQEKDAAQPIAVEA